MIAERKSEKREKVGRPFWKKESDGTMDGKRWRLIEDGRRDGPRYIYDGGKRFKARTNEQFGKNARRRSPSFRKGDDLELHQTAARRFLVGGDRRRGFVVVVIPRFQFPVSGRRQSPVLSHRQAAVSKVLVTQKGGMIGETVYLPRLSI